MQVEISPLDSIDTAEEYVTREDNINYRVRLFWIGLRHR